MRNLLAASIILTILIAVTCISSCESDVETSYGDLVIQIEMSDVQTIARADNAVDRLLSIFTPRAAHALPDLGFNSNSFPYNQFQGEMPADPGLIVLVTAPDRTFVAQTKTDIAGQVRFTAINSGYLTVVITGTGGNNYHVPVQVSEDTLSSTRVLIYLDPITSEIEINAKTIHDSNEDGINDDDFSYALFNRPWNSNTGGRVHLHIMGETRIDANGDGDFFDGDDFVVIEPDDDGISSDDGDGDEDNDGIIDSDDNDIDGDDIENADDPDIDGDGIPNADDSFPNGITTDDDFEPPTLFGGDHYTGVSNLLLIDSDTVTVYFPAATDEISEPVTYVIYYSTTSPIDFYTAYRQSFRPLGTPSGDDDLTDNVTVPVTNQTYYFAVHVKDSAQPPNEDWNRAEMSIEGQE